MIGIDADVVGARSGRGFVRRIEPDFLGTKRRKRFDHPGRTTAGIFVLMEAQPVVQLGRLLILVHRTRTWIDSACAVSPSACASDTMVGAKPASPLRVNRCTAMTRTKSAALNPPR